MKVENILPDNFGNRWCYTPLKKIDMWNSYMIFVSWIQPEKNANHEVSSNDIKEQTHSVFSQINDLLIRVWATLDDVIKAVIYVTDMDDFDKISEIRNEYFKKSSPVSTLVQVNAMTRKWARIEIEVTAMIEK